MVYMSGSRMSRHAASIVNRPSCGGGAKKAGTAPRVGWYLSSNVNLVGAPQTTPQFSFCVSTPNWPISTTIQTQSYGVRATHGGNMG
jgi:hypothetical protein